MLNASFRRLYNPQCTLTWKIANQYLLTFHRLIAPEKGLNARICNEVKVRSSMSFSLRCDRSITVCDTSVITRYFNNYINTIKQIRLDTKRLSKILFIFQVYLKVISGESKLKLQNYPCWLGKHNYNWWMVQFNLNTNHLFLF